ncbi:MAG: mechanosensitive ion channel family protein [Hyphomicrobiales bacterium]
MPDLTGDSIGVAKPWAEAVWRFLQSVFADEWALIQLGIIIAAYGVALLLSSALTPMFESQIRRIERQPELMRVLIVPLRRLKWIFFALILWGTMALLVRVTWPSRSYLIFVAASLVTAGVAITILSRFIRNRSVANLLAVTAWCIAALNITSLLDETVELLDAAAFSLGEVTISALVIIKGITLLAVLLWLAAITGNFLDRKIRESLELTPTLQVLIGKAIKFALIAAALLFSLSATGIDLTVLTIFSGALGLGIGFGLQKVAANLVSGIIILLDRSIKPGDVIELGGSVGWISSLRARYVSVVTRDGIEHLIPNEAFVTERVINWSFTTAAVRLEISFGVDYKSDPHQVRELAVEAVAALPRVIAAPKPVCHVTGFGDSSVDFVLRFWIEDPKNGLVNIRGAAFLALWDTFKDHDIQIPFPHRELRINEPVHVAMQEPRTPPVD